MSSFWTFTTNNEEEHQEAATAAAAAGVAACRKAYGSPVAMLDALGHVKPMVPALTGLSIYLN